VAILGWAFIKDSDDTRNTPAEPYYDLLRKAGAEVSVHDPYVTKYDGVDITQDLEEAVKKAAAVSIFTGHRMYRNLQASMIKKLSGSLHPVIVDGRNVVDPDKFIREGFVYKGIGRGDKNHHEII
jgi:UDP-N-acetyl-D-mannosaminuronic acid dehydrogenase